MDITPLVIALGATNANVFYLDLSDTRMNAEASDVLFGSIVDNRALWGLKYLSLRHCQFSENGINNFSHHLQNMYENHMSCLESLDFGGVGNHLTTILTSLVRFPQPLRILRISHTKLKGKAYTELTNILHNTELLEELDISCCSQIKPDQIIEIVHIITNNPKINTFRLNLSGLPITKKLTDLIAALQHKPEIWASLSFEDCSLSDHDIWELCQAMGGMTNLRSLSLGGNITSRSKISEVVNRIFNVSQLDSISLRGFGKKVLGAAGLRFVLQEAKIHTNIKHLNVSNSKAGNDGITNLTSFVEENPAIEELIIDGCLPKNEQLFITLFEAISHHPHLLNCPFPLDDVYQLLDKQPKAQRTAAFAALSDSQKGAQTQMQLNMAKKGVHSELSWKNIPELDEVLDQITMDVHQSLLGLRTTEHNGLATAFALPMPHLTEEESRNIHMQQSEVSDNGQTYDLPQSSNMCVEGDAERSQEEDADKLRTLQFNSLIIRRPNVASTFDGEPEMNLGVPGTKKKKVVRKSKRVSKMPSSINPDEQFKDLPETNESGSGAMNMEEKSESGSLSESGSPNGQRQKSRSASESGSPNGQRSRSGSRSTSESGSPNGQRSGSGSTSASESGSPNGQRTRSRSGSGSGSYEDSDAPFKPTPMNFD